MDKITTMQERINEMYKYAFSAGLVSSKQDFAEKVGITREVLSRYFSGKADPSKKTLAAINSSIGSPFSESWLLTGEGEMHADGATAPHPSSTCDPISMLITEMKESRMAKDEQIDRLLTIIERMQNGYK